MRRRRLRQLDINLLNGRVCCQSNATSVVFDLIFRAACDVEHRELLNKHVPGNIVRGNCLTNAYRQTDVT